MYEKHGGFQFRFIIDSVLKYRNENINRFDSWRR